MWGWGEAVITNSIHLRNNNTALSVNHDLFPSGSYWSAPAKISTHLPSLAVTSQDGAPAWPPAAALSVSFAVCTQEHSCPCTCMWDSELQVGWGQNCQPMEKAGSSQSEDTLQATLSGFSHWKTLFCHVISLSPLEDPWDTYCIYLLHHQWLANTRVPRRSTGIWDGKIYFNMQVHIFFRLFN